MDWPIEKFGAHAITYPYRKDYARAAIQSLSDEAVDRRVYSHSGWRNVAGRWLFLHAAAP